MSTDFMLKRPCGSQYERPNKLDINYIAYVRAASHSAIIIALYGLLCMINGPDVTAHRRCRYHI